VLREILCFLTDNFPDSHNWTYEYLNFRVRESAHTGTPGFFVVAIDNSSKGIVGVLSVSFKDIPGSKPLLIAELGDAYTKIKSYKSCDGVGDCLDLRLSHDIDLEYVRKSTFGALAFRIFAELDAICPDVVVGYPNAMALKSWTRRLGLRRLYALDIDYLMLPCLGFLLKNLFPNAYASTISQGYSPVSYTPSDNFDVQIVKELEACHVNGIKVVPLSTGLIATVDANRYLTLVYAGKQCKSIKFSGILCIMLNPRLKALRLPMFLVPSIFRRFIPMRLRCHKPAVARPNDVRCAKYLGSLSNQILFCDVP